MRASIACETSEPRWRRKPSAPPPLAKPAGVMKKVSLSDSSGPVIRPWLSSRSVSAETMEWPKRKAAPANSSEIVGSTVRS